MIYSIKVFLYLSLCLLIADQNVSCNTCDNYYHPTYGKGKCVHQDRCPYSLYSSGLCENSIDAVKCCFSTPTAGCDTYQHPDNGKGNCVKLNECGLGYSALPGYCDDKTSDFRCCFNNTQPKYKSCGLSLTNGKGICAQQVNCPVGQVLLTNECDRVNGEVCCYSLQSNVNVYEFRGVWVSTVANIDWPTKRTLTTDQQKQELIKILDTVKDIGLNAVVFQIRPTGDAYYQSNLEPWSIYLTGTLGKAPNPLYDPLEFMVSEAHKRNIEVHAWFNPYRARNKGETYSFTNNHMAVKYSQYAYTYGGYVWMDPAAEVVRNHTLSVIADVVTRYDVDAVHFDDYFYPYPDGTNDFPDQATYSAYVSSGGTLSKGDWRRDNVNKMIRETYNTIKSIKQNVQFGISPFGIWRPGNPAGIIGLDTFNSIFADAKTWLQSGWLDYLAPQLYWEIDPPAQSFSALLRWWCEQNTKGKLIYAGTAVYKLANNNWPANEISRQVQLTRDYRNIGSYGAIHFTMNYLLSNYKGIRDILKDLYSKPALTPFMKK